MTAMPLRACGERLGRSFHLRRPPALITETRNGHVLAVTELRLEQGCGLTAPIGHDDAYLVCLHLRELSGFELWQDGVPVAMNPPPCHGTVVLDLTRNPIAYVGEPMHVLAFYVPRAALAEACGDAHVAWDERRLGHDVPIDDAIIASLGQVLLPLMNGHGEYGQRFVNHVLHALCSHVAATYGGRREVERIERGGLAPWQYRCATELMKRHLVEGTSLAALAAECRLSTSAFVRAFKKSAGVSPHQWLLAQRVDRAIELMRDPGTPLADIAIATGFADQSHFTRIFARKTGVSPGAWRNARQGRRSRPMIGASPVRAEA
ncbi:AraC family transcriptional regulator [Dyella sp. C11]|uniref:helix-turn-helix domain-containing protein n=1 Tax=Dyella sp. C11 TaxID=2126991 RepID=UPI001E37E3FC|nr:AraC family transcriptional regulator [Dyella sp. C11]